MAATAQSAIMRLLRQRGEGKTICPSEAARALAENNDPAAWQPKMRVVHAAAQRLAERGLLDVMQHGQIIDLSSARGPVRLRLRTSCEEKVRTKGKRAPGYL
ncbi:MAG: DUF3253 domain-containing protein [Acidobacteria bacterium]|nr:DUF3253 domain-containing protein [Acidobacteriota bacterium]